VPELTISITKDTYGEYCVNYMLDGVRSEAKSYYTDDYKDAVATARQMIREYSMKGASYGN